jgi:uncharacterized protein YabN with tetrapyrrole methylase and pyrophosphatase domain
MSRETDLSLYAFNISAALPELVRAHKIGDATALARFDWSSVTEVIAKLIEEVEELKFALQHETIERQSQELGDVLFAAAQVARHLNLESEQCLKEANARFEKRYFTMRQQVAKRGLDWAALSAEAKEEAWRDVKKSLKAENANN